MKNTLFATFIIAIVFAITSNLAYADSNSNRIKGAWASIYYGNPDNLIATMNGMLTTNDRLKIYDRSEKNAVYFYEDGQKDKLYMGYNIVLASSSNGGVELDYYDNKVSQMIIRYNPKTTTAVMTKAALLSIGLSEQETKQLMERVLPDLNKVKKYPVKAKSRLWFPDRGRYIIVNFVASDNSSAAIIINSKYP